MADSPIGRPSGFTPDIANEICDRLAKGESLRSITGADRDDFMPSESTVRNWLAKGEAGEQPFDAFLRQYTRAREMQADGYAAEVIEIADAPNKQTLPDGTVIENDPQRDRLRIDARKWYASKLAPKKYGDKLDLSSSDGTMAPKPCVVKFIAPGSDDDGDD